MASHSGRACVVEQMRKLVSQWMAINQDKKGQANTRNSSCRMIVDYLSMRFASSRLDSRCLMTLTKVILKVF